MIHRKERFCAWRITKQLLVTLQVIQPAQKRVRQ